MANADGYVLPTPGTPKTLGILNVIFAVILLLIGLCQLGSTILAPAMLGAADRIGKEAQAKIEASQKEQKEARLKGLEEREKAATTDEEKKSIQQERDAVAAEVPAGFQPADMGAVTDMLKDPVVRGTSYLTLGTGVILHLMLLVAGIGLIRLTSWGRSLSVTWAGLQIAQLVLLAALNVFYVQPVTRPMTEKMLAKMEADAKLPGAAPGGAEGARMARAMSSPTMVTLFSLINPVVGSIYPIISLILLNKPGSRAACRGPKPSGPAEF